MIEQQIYSSNTTRSFPIAEGNTNVPKDIIIDMSITCPLSTEPVITAFNITEHTFFMSIEDSNTKKALGHLSIAHPAPYSLYTIKATDGSFTGWVVLGSGARTKYLKTDIALTIDPEVILTPPVQGDALSSLTINGISLHIDGLLNINSITPYIKVSVEPVDIQGVGSSIPCVVLRRNDNALDPKTIYGFFTQYSTYDSEAIYRIEGVSPDVDGNINIDTTPSSFSVSKIKAPSIDAEVNPNVPSRQEEYIGLLFNETAELCEEADDPSNKILHGRCEQGIVTSDGLPMDHLVEVDHPEYLLPDCGCADEGSGEGSGGWSP